MTQWFLIALGGNVRTRWGSPSALFKTLVTPAQAGACPALRWTSSRGLQAGWTPACAGVTEKACSRIVMSRPVGPGRRSFANAVVLIATDLTPPALLAHLKAIEGDYGRRPGRRWGDRPLDLDIIGWSGGRWRSRTLSIPHPAFRTRRFVLAPLADIAPGWRDPVTHRTARQLLARYDKRRLVR